MTHYCYTTFSSPFDTFTIVWKETDPNLQIQRIFLSDVTHNSESKARESFTNIKLGSSSQITSIGEKIIQLLNGKVIKFDLDWLDFNSCSEVQKKVLLAEYEVPRGWVSTYKRIAEKIGILNGARVVGNSLATNPFPIVIPCHRAIKTNGELGGYQGGIEMKWKLLEMEGIEFSDKGKVISDRVYY